jgi:hypothetical protein
MSTDPPPPQPVLAINDHGLLLGLDDTGAWVVWSPIHPSTRAHDRLVWLLPLLERHPRDVAATLHRHATPSPLPDLVRFALTAWGSHWPGLALGWLEAGWPTTDVLDVLATMKDNPKLAPATAPPSPTAAERRQNVTKFERSLRPT